MTDNGNKVGGPDFMSKLRDSLGRDPAAGTGDANAPQHQQDIPAAVQKFAPPDRRATTTQIGQQSPLQIIASSIKRLIWDDAEHMAATVCKHLNGDHANITGPVMAKAIQAAADELLKESS